jgi:hypothetical protein
VCNIYSLYLKDGLKPVLLSNEDILCGEDTKQLIAGEWARVCPPLEEDILCGEFTLQPTPGRWTGICPPLQRRCSL